jgi:hypothetical protein
VSAVASEGHRPPAPAGFHEIKHDGFRILAPGATVQACG